MPDRLLPRPPRARPIRPRGLEPADAVVLRAGGYADLARFSGVDISGVDLRVLELVECVLEDVRADRAHLEECRCAESRVDRLTASELHAQRSVWREVSWEASRVGAFECHDAQWRSVLLEDCRIGFLGLGRANLLDVRLRGCTVDTLDLTAATLTRVAFEDCRVGELRVRESRLMDVDLRGLALSQVDDAAGLRGAWVGADQLVELAPALAAHMGLRVL
ncbi:hypothetical protein SAMN05216355_10498 [Actinomyces ruminicola]|uniref:Pentapeptide repeat-containing protein n=1 Tax=Actinomyces ruminicola TaxID=332524 RepID=A0A1H0BL66_9ACTO|nr:hypothetical protein [Actinomyces ruminicola]SDN46390.1 hypothetical protein SAMN05216355_10498 [Actinomyces ruminicola]